MIPRVPRTLILALLAASSLMPACESVPLLAPVGSTITLTASNTAVPLNGTVDIIAQIIEPAGTPPHSGTHVTFTTTLGAIEPSEAETDVNGRAIVRFHAGTVSGTATINALSGSSNTSGTSSGSGGGSGTTTAQTGAVKIAVGTAAVGRVTLNATPATVPSTGGTTTLTANVYDLNGNTLSLVPVTFTTTAGTLLATVATTDSNGVATTTLTTSQQATVTASVGGQPTSGGGSGTTTPPPSGQASATITVNVSAVPALVITPPTTPPSAGLPASFTFAVTVAQNGSAVRSLVVNWGDGLVQDLGAVTGSAIVSHVYRTAGTYAVSGTVTDASGNAATVSTVVTVIPVARPTVIITPTPPSAPGGSTINISINISAPAGIAIQNVHIDFGDGFSQDLGGFSGVQTVPHPYPSGVRSYTITVDVLDSTGTTTRGSAVVSITT